jgi:hypothetical protein
MQVLAAVYISNPAHGDVTGIALNPQSNLGRADLLASNLTHDLGILLHSICVALGFFHLSFEVFLM